MTDRRTSDVLGALPNSRPHRRSEKRGARTADTGSTGHEAPPQTAASKPKSARRSSEASPAKPSASRPKATSGPRATSRPKATSGPKRAAGPKAASSPSPRKSAARRIRQPAQPGGTPKTPRANQPEPADQPDVLGTAIQAAAELAEIGLTVGARALRSAMSRLPRP
jgi:hypothetical protein